MDQIKKKIKDNLRKKYIFVNEDKWCNSILNILNIEGQN
jgi:hypothetical protein